MWWMCSQQRELLFYVFGFGWRLRDGAAIFLWIWLRDAIEIFRIESSTTRLPPFGRLNDKKAGTFSSYGFYGPAMWRLAL